MKLNPWISRFMILLILAVLLSGCSPFRSGHDSPQASEGYLDLRDWDFQHNGMARLDGEWAFYWERLLEPDQLEDHLEPPAYVHLPGGWSSHKGLGLAGQGHATYRLIIRLNETEEERLLALNVEEVRHAYLLWIDGRLAGQSGSVGTSRVEMEPSQVPATILFQPRGSEVELVLQVSNYVHKEGGVWAPLLLGTDSQIMRFTEKQVALDMFVVGSLIIMGLYHLGLYLLRRTEPSTLFFGVFCLVVGIRSLITGSTIIYRLLPGFDWFAALKIEYLSTYMGIPWFALYLHAMYREESPAFISKLSMAICSTFALFVLISPSHIYTYTLQAYHLFLLLMVVHYATVLLRAARNGRETAWTTTLVGLFFGVTIINDILHYNQIINTGDLVHLGLFVFIFAQSFNLSTRFSKAFASVERLSGEMLDLNNSLEEKVARRTRQLELYSKALEEANSKLQQLSYLDSLTNIPNRRYFGETLDKEWRNAIRAKLPMTIFMIDIDHFKEFNDSYGHQEGDACIRAIAGALQSALRRPRDFLARYGGEEFVVLLPQTDYMSGLSIASNLHKQVEELRYPHSASPIRSTVTISIGMAAWDADPSFTADDLLRSADEALYDAKRRGRNRTEGRALTRDGMDEAGETDVIS